MSHEVPDTRYGIQVKTATICVQIMLVEYHWYHR